MMDYDEIRNALQTLCHPASERLPEGQRLTLLIQRGQQAADAIDTLRRERDDWRGTAEHLLDIEQEWIDANSRLADECSVFATLLAEAREALERGINCIEAEGWDADDERALLAKIKIEIDNANRQKKD